MKSKIIEVNGVELTCYEDGSIEKIDGRSGKSVRAMGTPSSDGYRNMGIKRRMMQVHRLVATAWMGEIGEGLTVDHINGVKHDNRIENLRIVSRTQNMRGFQAKRTSTSSRYRGVRAERKSSKWIASIRVDGLYYHLGVFEDESDAAIAFNLACDQHGFANQAKNII